MQLRLKDIRLETMKVSAILFILKYENKRDNHKKKENQ